MEQVVVDNVCYNVVCSAPTHLAVLYFHVSWGMSFREGIIIGPTCLRRSFFVFEMKGIEYELCK